MGDLLLVDVLLEALAVSVVEHAGEVIAAVAEELGREFHRELFVAVDPHPFRHVPDELGRLFGPVLPVELDVA